MNDTPPVVSVIVPCRNEKDHIEACLRSIQTQEPVPGGFEIIVADGMSDDGTRDMLTRLAEKEPRLRVIDNPGRIVPTALNAAIREARGNWVIRLDAHSEYPLNYLKLCLETSQRTGAENVGGAFITSLRDDRIEGKLVRALTTHPFGVGNAGFRVGAPEGKADTVPYGCYRREVFERIGLFDERLVRNQDYEFNRRLFKAGGSIWYNPSIQVGYYNQSTLKGLVRQALATGQWNVLMWYVAPYSFAWRHAIPLGFVGALFSALLLFFIAPVVGMLAIKVILLPYLAVALGASLQQSVRHGKWMFPCLPFLFWSYHVAYGLGGLSGTWLLLTKRAPVQLMSEPWPGAGSYRAWPLKAKNVAN